MKRKAYTCEDGTVAILDVDKDETLYDSQWVDGRQQNRGTDLIVHKTKKGKLIFYEYNWTQWQGECSSIIVLDGESIGIAKWILERYGWFSEKEL